MTSETLEPNAQRQLRATLGYVAEADEIPAGTVVTRPDGRTVTVSGGYVFDTPGVHTIDGEDIYVEADQAD